MFSGKVKITLSPAFIYWKPLRISNPLIRIFRTRVYLTQCAFKFSILYGANNNWQLDMIMLKRPIWNAWNFAINSLILTKEC